MVQSEVEDRVGLLDGERKVRIWKMASSERERSVVAVIAYWQAKSAAAKDARSEIERMRGVRKSNKNNRRYVRHGQSLSDS